MQCNGTLFRYGARPVELGFQSGSHSRHLILVSGLEEGLLSLPYAPHLASALDSHNWSLVQAQLFSSYQSYGVSSLDRDARDIHNLALYLKAERNCTEFIIMGNSTGCQDAVRFFKLYGKDTSIPKLSGVILHAPVSDSEIYEQDPSTAKRIEQALKMRSDGKEDEILYRDYTSCEGAPITSRRYLALAQRRGDDDMFSSYLSDPELQDLLGHMKDVRTLILVSGADEYIPDSVDKKALAERFVAAIGGNAECEIIQGADHSASNRPEEVVQAVERFLQSFASD